MAGAPLDHPPAAHNLITEPMPVLLLFPVYAGLRDEKNPIWKRPLLSNNSVATWLIPGKGDPPPLKTIFSSSTPSNHEGCTVCLPVSFPFSPISDLNFYSISQPSRYLKTKKNSNSFLSR